MEPENTAEIKQDSRFKKILKWFTISKVRSLLIGVLFSALIGTSTALGIVNNNRTVAGEATDYYLCIMTTFENEIIYAAAEDGLTKEEASDAWNYAVNYCFDLAPQK